MEYANFRNVCTKAKRTLEFMGRTLFSCPQGGGGGGGGGALAGQPCPMREQRTAKLTLNGVFDILKLMPIFTLFSQKVTLSNVNVVN